MRQAIVLLAAAALLAGGAGVIILGGTAVRPRVEQAPAATTATVAGEAPSANTTPKISTERPAFKSKTERQAASRAVQSEDEGAATAPADAGFERVDPRPALSDIGQALPPKPPSPDDRKATVLARPVATSAGTLEVMGYTIALRTSNRSARTKPARPAAPPGRAACVPARHSGPGCAAAR